MKINMKLVGYFFTCVCAQFGSISSHWQVKDDGSPTPHYWTFQAANEFQRFKTGFDWYLSPAGFKKKPQHLIRKINNLIDGTKKAVLRCDPNKVPEWSSRKRREAEEIDNQKKSAIRLEPVDALIALEDLPYQFLKTGKWISNALLKGNECSNFQGKRLVARLDRLYHYSMYFMCKNFIEVIPDLYSDTMAIKMQTYADIYCSEFHWYNDGSFERHSSFRDGIQETYARPTRPSQSSTTD